jgi:hypothetical protein
MLRTFAKWILPVTVFILCLSQFTAAAGAANDEKTLDLGPAAGEKPALAEKSGQPVPTALASDEKAFAGGAIEGTILPAARVRRVRVVEREAKLAREAAYDSATGRFKIDKLPAGLWAVEVETPWGRVEGVDLVWRPGNLAKAVAAEKSNGAKPPALGDEDKTEIRRHISDVDRFMKARDLTFVGNGRQVAVLVDLLRDGDFHGRKGDEVIWRLEVWYYQNLWGTWERLGGQVVFRERQSGQTFHAWTRQFEPALGGLEIAPKTSESIVVNYTVPELPSPSRGLVAQGQKSESSAKPVEAKKSANEPK